MGKVSPKSQSNLPEAAKLVDARPRAQHWSCDCPSQSRGHLPSHRWRHEHQLETKKSGGQSPWEHRLQGPRDLVAPGLSGAERAADSRHEPTLVRTTSVLSEKVALGTPISTGLFQKGGEPPAPRDAFSKAQSGWLRVGLGGRGQRPLRSRAP